jgi:hypothetical protein
MEATTGLAQGVVSLKNTNGRCDLLAQLQAENLRLALRQTGDIGQGRRHEGATAHRTGVDRSRPGDPKAAARSLVMYRSTLPFASPSFSGPTSTARTCGSPARNACTVRSTHLIRGSAPSRCTHSTRNAAQR